MHLMVSLDYIFSLRAEIVVRAWDNKVALLVLVNFEAAEIKLKLELSSVAVLHDDDDDDIRKFPDDQNTPVSLDHVAVISPSA